MDPAIEQTSTMITKRENKRRRKDETVKKAAANQCEFYLERKNRRCAMQRKKAHRFCSEHLTAEHSSSENPERVPCPLDHKHSVWLRDLASHLRKCNARPAKSSEPWFVENCNRHINNDAFVSDEPENTQQADDKSVTLEQVISLLQQYENVCVPLQKHIRKHDGLDKWLEIKGNKKHVLQQSSLIGSMQDSRLLADSNFYVEFGCGKAELSRMVNACIVHDTLQSRSHSLSPSPGKDHTYGFGLIDRGVNRMKMDSKIVSDTEGCAFTPLVRRSRIDIQHLDLDKFLESTHCDSLVGISKHLCGAATDLTLKSIFNSKSALHSLKGVVVAMCCRHVCDYDQLLPQSRAYLSKHGVNGPMAFSVLKRIVSWAVCGKREGRPESRPEKNDGSVLSFEEKEHLGFLARQLIDESRVYAVNQRTDKFKAEVFIYAERDVTLENHCLRITRK